MNRGDWKSYMSDKERRRGLKIQQPYFAGNVKWKEIVEKDKHRHISK